MKRCQIQSDMSSNEMLFRNFEEVRRRSLKVWRAIPEHCLTWQPDGEAMTALAMVRHVLEGEHLYHVIVKSGGNLGDYKSPWAGRSLVNVEDELSFASAYRDEFIKQILGYTAVDLTMIQITRSEKHQPPRMLGDYLNRILYHESVHCGQMLGYLRSCGVRIPDIWD